MVDSIPIPQSPHADGDAEQEIMQATDQSDGMYAMEHRKH